MKSLEGVTLMISLAVPLVTAVSTWLNSRLEFLGKRIDKSSDKLIIGQKELAREIERNDELIQELNEKLIKLSMHQLQLKQKINYFTSVFNNHIKIK